MKRWKYTQMSMCKMYAREWIPRNVSKVKYKIHNFNIRLCIYLDTIFCNVCKIIESEAALIYVDNRSCIWLSSLFNYPSIQVFQYIFYTFLNSNTKLLISENVSLIIYSLRLVEQILHHWRFIRYTVDK